MDEMTLMLAYLESVLLRARTRCITLFCASSFRREVSLAQQGSEVDIMLGSIADKNLIE